MPFDAQWFRPKNAGVIMSWLAPPSGKARARKVTDNRLADINIPLGEWARNDRCLLLKLTLTMSPSDIT